MKKQFKYKDYMILCRKGWDWTAAIRRPDAPDVMMVTPEATSDEGLVKLLERAKAVIDEDLKSAAQR